MPPVINFERIDLFELLPVMREVTAQVAMLVAVQAVEDAKGFYMKPTGGFGAQVTIRVRDEVWLEKVLEGI